MKSKILSIITGLCVFPRERKKRKKNEIFGDLSRIFLALIVYFYLFILAFLFAPKKIRKRESKLSPSLPLCMFVCLFPLSSS